MRPRRRIEFAELRAMPAALLAEHLAGEPEDALAHIAAAARYGLVEAQVLLGQALLDGRGTRRDPVTAVHWFTAAAEAGCAAAMNMLGRCHELGWGVRRNDATAVQWYSQAAEQGLDWAQFNLAGMLLRGRGAKRDRRQALFLYLRAAHQGHAKSMNMVGRCFEEGWEVARDLGAAREWYRYAAKGGDFRGQYNLGSLLVQEGRIAEAAAWLKAAVLAGTQDVLRSAAESLSEHAEPALRAVGALAATRLGGPAERAEPSTLRR